MDGSGRVVREMKPGSAGQFIGSRYSVLSQRSFQRCKCAWHSDPGSGPSISPALNCPRGPRLFKQHANEFVTTSSVILAMVSLYSVDPQPLPVATVSG